MSGKDVLTLLLCSFGYDRNVRINIERIGYDEPCYDVHAENAEGDVYEECNSEGLMFHIYLIIAYMTHYNHYIKCPSEKTRYLDLQELNFESKWWKFAPKHVLDETQRNKLIENEEKRNKRNKRI